MDISFVRDDYRTYQIDPITIGQHIKEFIVAVESGVYGTIRDGWYKLRYIIAPNPGGNPSNIDQSTISDPLKIKLIRVLATGNVGPHSFQFHYLESLALLRECLSLVKGVRAKQPDARAKFAYDLRAAPEWNGWKKSLAEFNKEAIEKGWIKVSTINGLKHIVKAYAINNGEPPLPG